MQTNMGENVRRLRTVKGLTQEQLAQAIGISQTMIMRIENGSKLPGIATVIAMHFCSRLLRKEPKEKNKAPAMIVFCAFEQMQTVIDYGKRYLHRHP